MGKKPRTAWTQPTLATTLGVAEPRGVYRTLRAQGAQRATRKLPVVDLFCGLGGWSEGCRQAGFQTVLAIDSNMRLLKLHKLNHPRSTHCAMTLGPDTEEDLVSMIRAHVPEGQPYHLHGSPPCQEFTAMKAVRGERSPARGIKLVVWYLRLVARLRPWSWSMEEVAHPMVHRALAEARAQDPKLVAYVPKVHMCEYGVPQTRKRCIAGTPRVVKRLVSNARLRARAPTIQEVLAPPEGATLMMTSLGKVPDPDLTMRLADGTFVSHDGEKFTRALDQVAWTCVANHTHRWCSPDFQHIRVFTAHEQLLLQAFPSSYKIGKGCTLPNLGIGNAVPPLFAKKFMSCVRAPKQNTAH